MAHDIIFFLLTGDPGVGKTTLIKKLVYSLANIGVKSSGFYTEEIKRQGTREGFDVVSLDGVRGCLARDQSLLRSPSVCKVGKYGVLVQEFEAVALPSLEKKNDSLFQILVIDEIGKMEFFSASFKSKIKHIFSETSNIVLATIPIRKSDALIEKVRGGAKTKVWTVTRENRNSIHEDILQEMKVSLNIS